MSAYPFLLIKKPGKARLRDKDVLISLAHQQSRYHTTRLRPETLRPTLSGGLPLNNALTFYEFVIGYEIKILNFRRGKK
jgi:hypothetical protein